MSWNSGVTGLSRERKPEFFDFAVEDGATRPMAFIFPA